MGTLKKALIRVREGYTPKELFKLKLTGEAVNVLRDTLARELDEWLMEREIFEIVPEVSNAQNKNYIYRCMYPVNIWHVNGRGGNEQIKVDNLKPGDIWGF